MTGQRIDLTTATAERTREIGVALGYLLRAGDLVVLSGDLGAGKTTLTQGIGEGIGVRGPVTSPTFVIARTHPNLSDGPELVHVDAYRLTGPDEVDDLDLDDVLGDAVVVVEWGRGRAEHLASSRLILDLSAADESDVTDPEAVIPDTMDLPLDAPRLLTMTGYGPRWDGGAWEELRSNLAPLR